MHGARRRPPKHPKARRPNPEALEKIIAKKAHHHVKVIKKELKKSKEFEVRKILRRIKQAKADDDGAGKAAVAIGLLKLEQQLAVAKAVDIAQLAAKAATECGLPVSGAQGLPQRDGSENGEALPGANPVHMAQQTVESRILRAKVVQSRLEEVRKDMEKVRQAAARREQAAAAGAAATGTEPASSAGGQAATAQQQQQDGDPAVLQHGRRKKQRTAEEPEQVLGDVAAGALSKLLGARNSKGSLNMLGATACSGSDSDSDFGVVEHSSGDSGLLSAGSEDEGVLAGRHSPRDSWLSDSVEGGEDDADKHVHTASIPALGAQEVDAAQRDKQARKKANEPLAKKSRTQQKPKNRLGQRARRRLAAMQYGSDAKHRQQEQRKQSDQQQQRRQPQKQPDQQQEQHGSQLAALHPSWAAKQAQKQKLSLSLSAAMPAKKVVFDEADHQVGHAQQPTSGRAAEGKQARAGRAAKDKLGGAATKPLHPSWEAKKRQQEQQRQMILPAAGKKVVFDDD